MKEKRERRTGAQSNAEAPPQREDKFSFQKRKASSGHIPTKRGQQANGELPGSSKFEIKHDDFQIVT